MDNNNSIFEHLSDYELEISDYKKEILNRFLKKMILIRHSELKIADARKNGFIKGPVHLSVGQEAIPVGLSEYLLPTDKVFGAHRSHAHILSLGVDLRKFFAEILSRVTGICGGMGGSMHLHDKSIGFYGSVPIVGGTVPLAVGTALSSKLRSENDVSIAYLGDGAIEEGVVQESLNFARIKNCPIIFVVENNLFSSHMNISLRQPKSLTSRFAESNNIEFKIIDGNNIINIANSASKYVSRCRKGEGPFFIEAITYRWFGHVDWRDDIDVGVDRSKEDLSFWKSKDPLKRLKDALIGRNFLNKEEYEEINTSIQNKVNSSFEKAINDPPPNWEKSQSNVFSNKRI